MLHWQISTKNEICNWLSILEHQIRLAVYGEDIKAGLLYCYLDACELGLHKWLQILSTLMIVIGAAALSQGDPSGYCILLGDSVISWKAKRQFPDQLQRLNTEPWHSHNMRSNLADPNPKGSWSH